MDYEYYFVRTIGWGPALLVLLFGTVMAVRSGSVSRRGRWCLAAAMALQSTSMLVVPMAKDAVNKMMNPLVPWSTLATDHSPRPSIQHSPPLMGSQFEFNRQYPFDDRVWPGSLLPIFICPSHYPDEQLEQHWHEYREKRWKWTLWEVLPDSLLTALTWGLILFAVFDRSKEQKFLKEIDHSTDDGA